MFLKLFFKTYYLINYKIKKNNINININKDYSNYIEFCKIYSTS